MRSVIIGIDGGGTKTSLLALDARSGQRIANATVGSIHALSLGTDTAVQNLKQGLNALQLSPDDTVIGCAMGDPSMDDSGGYATADSALFTPLQALLPQSKCFIKSDVFMALYAFSGGEPAALLIAGTGSMGVALTRHWRCDSADALVTVGGWGYPTFDPGSGYFIAVRGIQAAINAFDRVAAPTALCDVILPFFGVDAPRKLIDILNSDSLSRSQIAAFSKQVAVCAEKGDSIAKGILEHAGALLANYACTLMHQTGQSKIGIYGSILLYDATVRTAFETHIKENIPTAEICVPAKPPEYGAAMLAADALGIDRRSWA